MIERLEGDGKWVCEREKKKKERERFEKGAKKERGLKKGLFFFFCFISLFFPSILTTLMASAPAQPRVSRDDYKRRKELEEARKAGTVPAEVDEEGR